MNRIVRSWKKLSTIRKLYLVVGTMATLIICELLVLKISMQQVSAVRAFVSGEALWSKSQKDALLELKRYERTKDEKFYQLFLNNLKVPDGDHLARIELLKQKPDLTKVREGFLRGRIHPDDIDGMIFLLKQFHKINYISEAISDWSEADGLLQQIRDTAEELHGAVRAGNKTASAGFLDQINELNSRLTPVEDHFSYILGEGSRWLESTVLTIFFLMVLTVEATGLTLTVLTGREIAEVATENAKLYAEAKQSVKMRDEFLSVASHELKTPLTSLSLQLELIHRTLKNPNTPDTIGRTLTLSERSIASTKRLTTLLEELLDLTRIRVGQLSVNRQLCDLVSIVQDSVTQLGPEAAKNGSTISTQTHGSVMGLFDSTRINQVMVNLLSNAIKYGNGKPIQVSVELLANQAKVVVQDQGLGIPANKLSNLFQRYERFEKDPSIPGLGLGLYITHEIVKAHGGTLLAESSVDEGSTFTMILDTAA